MDHPVGPSFIVEERRMSPVRFECRSVGYSCEWALSAGSASEVVERVRDLARCAHNLPDLPADLVKKVESTIHPA